MARQYAGVLGCLAFATTLVRGLVARQGFEQSLQSAIGALIALAAVGLTIGLVADLTINESVRNIIQRETAPAEKK